MARHAATAALTVQSTFQLAASATTLRSIALNAEQAQRFESSCLARFVWAEDASVATMVIEQLMMHKAWNWSLVRLLGKMHLQARIQGEALEQLAQGLPAG